MSHSTPGCHWFCSTSMNPSTVQCYSGVLIGLPLDTAVYRDSKHPGTQRPRKIFWNYLIGAARNQSFQQVFTVWGASRQKNSLLWLKWEKTSYLLTRTRTHTRPASISHHNGSVHSLQKVREASVSHHAINSWYFTLHMRKTNPLYEAPELSAAASFSTDGHQSGWCYPTSCLAFSVTVFLAQHRLSFCKIKPLV